MEKTTVIRTTEDLCYVFDVAYDGRWLWRLNKSVYNDSDCGPYVSVFGKVPGDEDAAWYHSGEGRDLTGFVLMEFQFGTIIEGNDGTVEGTVFRVFPDGVEVEKVREDLKDIELEADRIWNEVNSERQEDRLWNDATNPDPNEGTDAQEGEEQDGDESDKDGAPAE